MDKIKLKPSQEVIYFDGFSILDKTSVIEINKEQGTAKLANGIILQRESTKKGYFKRAGIRSDAKAWLANEENEGTKIYQAYLSKCQDRKLVLSLQKVIECKSIQVNMDQAWLIELHKTLKEFLEL